MENSKIRLTDKPEYQIYHQMKQRCYNPKNKKYPDYGGRGITMDKRWLEPNGFINFMEDMKERPSDKHSIERIDVNGNYEPSNCIWITMSEQTMNKRTTAILKEGDVFGKLTILKEVQPKDRTDITPNTKRRMFLCKCSCGKEVIKRMDKLRQGNITSCGLKPCNKHANHSNKITTI